MCLISINRFLSIILALSYTLSALPLGSPHPRSADVDSDLAAGSAYIPTARAAIPQDFPDPSVIKINDTYYAFATASAALGRHIQIAKATVFSSSAWTALNDVPDPLPDSGAWTDHSINIWAPYVMQTSTGSFVMYYAAPPAQDPSKHCIGTATSKTITGPYIPAAAPFACDLSIGGAIDPSVFQDPKSGNTFVTYKVDGNSLGHNSPTPIMLQQINPADGVTKIGGATKIFDQDPTSASDGSLVEAPTMMFSGGTYFLLFSTNDYTTEKYDIRYVTSSSLQGPYDKTQKTLMKTGDGNGVVGPGSCDVDGDGRIVFHGRVSAQPLRRDMYAGAMTVQGNRLSVSGMV